MLDSLLDATMDTLRILPYLFATFLILEFIEHKFTQKSQTLLAKANRLGPVVGGFLGSLPQCGFSAMAAEFFSGKIITIGTLIAIFLSTSDEMLVIMLSEGANLALILGIIAFKITIGTIIGLVIDAILKNTSPRPLPHIANLCDHAHCGCKDHGIWQSSLIHTAKTGLFIFAANLLISLLLHFIGTETLTSLLRDSSFLAYLVAALVGLIPNCASSIILTELFLGNIISLGTLLSGLLPASGLGLLLLFKTNKNLKQNLYITLALCSIGIISGIFLDFFL